MHIYTFAQFNNIFICSHFNLDFNSYSILDNCTHLRTTDIFDWKSCVLLTFLLTLSDAEFWGKCNFLPSFLKPEMQHPIRCFVFDGIERKQSGRETGKWWQNFVFQTKHRWRWCPAGTGVPTDLSLKILWFNCFDQRFSSCVLFLLLTPGLLSPGPDTQPRSSSTAGKVLI